MAWATFRNFIYIFFRLITNTLINFINFVEKNFVNFIKNQVKNLYEKTR